MGLDVALAVLVLAADRQRDTGPLDHRQTLQYQLDLDLREVSRGILTIFQPEFKDLGIPAVVASIDHSDIHPVASAILPLAMAEPDMAGALMQQMKPAVLRGFTRLCYKLLDAIDGEQAMPDAEMAGQRVTETPSR